MTKPELTEISVLILSTLTKPIHGYEIMKQIDDALGSVLSVGPATLYTTLSKLLKAGFCQYRTEGKKKVYHLTEKGKQVLHEEYEKRVLMLDFLKKQL